jgi:hypothetical protein
MKKQYIIIMVTALSISLIWFLLLFSPLIQRKKEIASSLADTESKLTDFRKILRGFPERFKSEKEILQKREVYISQLYSKEDLIALFDNIRIKAARYNLNLLEISPSVEELLALNRQTPNNDQPQLLNIMVRLNGYFRNLGEFVRDMEEERFYQGANFCKISGAADGTAPPQMALGFKAFLGTYRKS